MDGFIDLVEFQCAGSGQTSRYYKNIYHDILGSRVMQVATTAAMQVVFDKIVHQGLVAAAADANNDGALDVLFHSDANYGAILTDTSNPSEFLPLTIDRTGIGYNGYYPPASWNISTIDYDLNGDMDFAVARYDGLKKSAFFPNDPDQQVMFDYTTAFEWGQRWGYDLGICVADFSLDGYADVFLPRAQSQTQTNEFFWTGQPEDFNYRAWVGIDLYAPGLNPDPGDTWYTNYDCIGATVILHADTHVQAQVVDGGCGRANQAEHTLIFGLDDYSGSIVDYIEVVLPNGERMQFVDLAVNETHRIPVNGSELVTSSMDFNIELNADDTQDWVVTWKTNQVTDFSQDKVVFSVASSDEIETMVRWNPVNHGQTVTLTGVGEVTLDGTDYLHEMRLDNVICEGNRTISCDLFSSTGSYTLHHSFPVKKILYCLQSN